MNEELINSAMQIILFAGDARLHTKNALSAIAEGNFVEAKDALAKAQEEIRKAHQVQTDAIQGEAQGKENGYSLLFTHAQDTLMTIYSEINIAKQLIHIFEKYDERLKIVEGK